MVKLNSKGASWNMHVGNFVAVASPGIVEAARGCNATLNVFFKIKKIKLGIAMATSIPILHVVSVSSEAKVRLLLPHHPFPHARARARTHTRHSKNRFPAKNGYFCYIDAM